MDVARFRSHAAEQVFRAPCAESLSLFPRHTHHGVVVVGRRREIVFQIRPVVCIGEVVHPNGGVGIHGNDVGV